VGANAKAPNNGSVPKINRVLDISQFLYLVQITVTAAAGHNEPTRDVFIHSFMFISDSDVHTTLKTARGDLY